MRMKFPSEEAAEVVFNKLQPMEINGKTFVYEPPTEGKQKILLIWVGPINFHLNNKDLSLTYLSDFSLYIVEVWTCGKTQLQLRYF